MASTAAERAAAYRARLKADVERTRDFREVAECVAGELEGMVESKAVRREDFRRLARQLREAVGA